MNAKQTCTALFVACTALLGTSVIAALEGRPRLPLAGEWQAQFLEQADAKPAPDGPWTPQKLPGSLRLCKGKKEIFDTVWLRRTVTVPQEWAGKRVVLNLFQVKYACDVYVDGSYVTEVPAYGAEVDLAAHITPGKEHQLQLRLGRMGLGHRLPNAAVRDLIAGIQAQVDRGGWDRGTKFCALGGPPEALYLEAQPRGPRITDVWYRTATRALQRLEPEVALQTATPLSGAVARVTVYKPEADEPVLTYAIPLPPLGVGETTCTDIIPAKALKQWDIFQPNLYRGQVILENADGKELDRTEPVTFGMREFWIQGRHTYLNNHPVHLVIEWGKPEEKVPLGANLIEPAIPWEARHVGSSLIGPIREADRLGAACVGHGVIHHLMDLGNPAIARGVETWWRHRYRKLRNHPSVFIYGLGINSPGNFMDFDPWKLGRQSNLDWSNLATSLCYQIHKRVAPREAFYFHGGPRGGDISTGNFYTNHIPTQEVEDWFHRWASGGDMPIMLWEGMGGPLHVDYRKGGGGLATEFNAIHFGDRAYAEETDDYLAYCNWVLPRKKHWANKIINHNKLAEASTIQAITRAHRTWRYYGVPFKSWGMTYKNETLQQADRATLAPDLAWIAGPVGELPEKDHNYYSGATIEKSIALIRDRVGKARWRIDWAFAPDAGGKALRAAQTELTLGTFMHKQHPIRVTAPEVDTPTDYALTATVKDLDADRVIATDRFTVTVHPRRTEPEIGLTVSALDPEGKTIRWLRNCGVRTRPLAAGTKPLGDILLVGRRALRKHQALPFTADDVAAGLRVVLFAQHCDALGGLGLRHEDMGPRTVFPRQPDHPLLAGVTAAGLCDWRGSGTLMPDTSKGDRQPVGRRLYHCGSRGTVASVVIETPQHGPFQTILDCEFDLGYSPLLTWRHGAGEVVFCQLDLTGRVERDPVATRIADNLVAYLKTPLEHPQSKSALCLPEALQQKVEALGYAAVPFTPAGLDPARHVVVCGPGADLDAPREALDRFVQAGGTVLALHADADLLAAPLFGPGWQLEKTVLTRAARAPEAHPLLRGVGPQNIHWRLPVALQTIVAAPGGATRLLGNTLAIHPRGQGRVIVFQVAPAAFQDVSAAQAADPQAKDTPLAAPKFLAALERSRWQVDRLHSLLLANLRVQSSPALAERLTSVRRSIPMTPIDAWVYFGPYAPPTKLGNPLERPDLATLAENRNLRYRGKNTRGEAMRWHVPSDSLNGMGLNGEMDLAKVYGVHLRDAAVAVTQVWSSRAREATIEVGADWWLQVSVNGEEVFRTAKGKGKFGVRFGRPTKVPLKAGWNDIRCVVAAGSNGHLFWFRMTDPGDLVVAQSTTAPSAAPAELPAVEDLLPEEVDQGYGLYHKAALKPWDDPYSFVPW